MNCSFVVQGPVVSEQRITLNVLESIRTNFPGSEIILSTWKGTDVSELTGLYDQLVLSDDPGGYKVKIDGYLNVNRQIISSKAGIDIARHEYIVKTRTDIVFKNNNILHWYHKYNKKVDPEKSVFRCKEKILVTNLTSVNPAKDATLFAVCDWVYMGETEDLKSFFTLPLYPVEYTNYFDSGDTSLRYNAEQWIIIKNLEKKQPFEFEHRKKIDRQLLQLHENMYRFNLILVDFSQLGITSLKYRYTRFGLHLMYTFNEWKKIAGEKAAIFDWQAIFYKIISLPLLRNTAKKMMRK